MKKRWENSYELDFDNDNNQVEVKAICNIAVFARKLNSGYLPSLYYLIS